MGYYALFYRDLVPDYTSRRATFREEHLGLAREAYARGELVMAGALADPTDGALLIFRTDDVDSALDRSRRELIKLLRLIDSAGYKLPTGVYPG
jgi:uncharacterized protein YciI